MELIRLPLKILISVKEAVERFGSQCIVVAGWDVKREYNDPPRWSVYTHGGRNKTSSYAAGEWVKLMEQNERENHSNSVWIMDGTKKEVDLVFTTNGIRGS